MFAVLCVVTNDRQLSELNRKLNAEIEYFKNRKHVNLENPEIFKSNIKDLVEDITVQIMSDKDLLPFKRKHKRHTFYKIDVKMFDDETAYEIVTNNLDDKLPRPIKIERV